MSIADVNTTSCLSTSFGESGWAFQWNAMVCSIPKCRSWKASYGNYNVMTLLFPILFAGLRHSSDMLKELLTLIGVRQLGCTVDPRRIVAWGDKALHGGKTYSITICLCGDW